MREYEWRSLACAHVKSMGEILFQRVHRHVKAVVSEKEGLEEESGEKDDLIINRFLPKHIFLGKARNENKLQNPMLGK